MIKNTSKLTKTRVLAAVITFVVLFLRAIFEISQRGVLSFGKNMFLVFCCASFSLFFYLNITEKGEKLISGQGFSGIALLIAIAAGLFSYQIITYEMLLFLAVLSVSALAASSVLLLPVTAGIGIAIATNFNISTVAWLPSLIGAALVCYGSRVKGAKLWEKVVFAVSCIVMFATAVYSFYDRRYMFSFISLRANYKCYIPIILVAAILIFLAVKSIKNKVFFTDAIGYILPAVTLIVMVTMDVRFVVMNLVSVLAAMFMMFAKNEAANKYLDEIIETVKLKYKK